MASKDESGLFSRVVRFVKNSTTSWSEADSPDTEQDSAYSKQVLKEMIERKRRNDFVRKREFDMLRKLRRSEAMARQDPAARPSFFQSSLPSKPDDRAVTLKKIDEIEAQMSMQWWKNKHADAAPQRDSVASTQGPATAEVPLDTPNSDPGPPTLKSTAYTSTDPQPLPAGGKAPASATAKPLLARVTPQPAGAPRSTVAAPPASKASAAGGPPSEAPPSTQFTPSKYFAIDVEEFAHDPELEEASIRFANGDDAGAEAGLLEVLGPRGARINHDETWLALFDLYRATGQQGRFETAAIDFARRFGRSAPQWFSMPELVSRMSSGSEAPGATRATEWASPAVFGTQTVAAVNAALNKAPSPWKINWSKLSSISESAVEPLTRLFTQWAANPVQLRFVGAPVLETVLKSAAPSGDRSVSPAWWRLRMEVLRVMHRPDDFELVALDYCVTYEVSPPSWENPRCECKTLEPDGTASRGQTIIGAAFRDSFTSGMSTGYGDSQTSSGNSQMSNVSSVELAGQILGDATETLDTLESRLAGADLMVISCSRLIRIDFTAAGTLLNWVTSRHTEGRQVQFVEVHRLVAAFFNVVGISEHSRIITRQD